MDIQFHVHRWLLGMVFIVLLHQSETASGSASWRICPQGQLYHAPNHERTGGRPYGTCCFPTRCGVGEEVRPCASNGTHDKCLPCETHYNQSQRTSSFTMNKRCVKWPLDENCEKEDGRKDYSDWKTRRCLCELERGFMFKLPEAYNIGSPKTAFCQIMDKCDAGSEPTVEGKCQQCEAGYFKEKRGHRLCEPQTECHELGLDNILSGGLTADNKCSDPVIFTTPKPVHPTVKLPIVEPGGGHNPHPPGDGDTDESTAKPSTTTIKSGSSRGFNDNDDPEGGSRLWPIILAVIFLLIVVVVIAVILFYRKRKGMSICGCAGLKSNDVEKNHRSGIGQGQYKSSSGNGILNEPQLMVVTKGVNNNINGGLPQHHNSGNHRYPYAQHNGNTVHFSESSDLDSQVFQNQKNSYQTRMSPTSRPGILRNGGDQSQQVMFAPYAASRSQDLSMDSIGREKLHVNTNENGFEANQDLGENDPLLVSEGINRTAALPSHDILHNPSYVASNSPPIPISSNNPRMFPAAGATGHPNIQNAPVLSHPVGNMNPTFNNSNGSSFTSPTQTGQPTHQVTFAPAADTVTFKRSISVIASPEGEVEEEELEANVPRFSQILPDGEEPPSAVESNPILRMLQDKENLPMDSPQREVTHQMRLPAERLQHRLLQNPIGSAQQQRNQSRNPHQGFPPALFRASSQPTPDSNIPDHCIMDLKEQQLANSPSLEESSLIGTHPKLLTGSDPSDTGLLKLEDFMSSLDQTDLKVCPENNAESASSGAKNSNSNSKLPDLGMFVIGSGGSAQNTLERKRSGNNSLQRRRFLSGTNRQSSVERKRRSSGSDSTQNTLELKRVMVGGDKQRSCLKNFSLEDGETEEKKLRLGRTVSFDAEEEKCIDSVGHETNRKHVGDSLSSSDSKGPYVDTAVDLRKEPQAVDDEYDGENDSDGEETDPKQRQSDLDLSSSEDGQASPPASNTYRRCQSESASSSTEAAQKPPPRSLSEEKPLKMERPIAKVKPMPASDNSVNKLVTDEEGTATANGSSSGAANILDYSSESSSGEEGVPREPHVDERNTREECDVYDSDEEEGRQ